MNASDADIDERVKAFVAKVQTAVSEADVAAGTGVDIGTIKRRLYALMKRYESALEVSDDGTLAYDFGPRLRRLDKPTIGERLRAAARVFWRGFSVVYKASLAVALVAYAVAFVAVILAASIVASIAAEDDAPVSGAFNLVGAVFQAIFDFSTVTSSTYIKTDRHGYPHRHSEPKRPVLPKKRGKEQPHEKSFIASVYDFVLGPPRAAVSDGAQKREVAAFVRKNDGVLTVADVQALSGMSRAEAERFFAAFVAEFDGDAGVGDEGVLYARFVELMRKRSDHADEPIVHYWDEYEAPHELTGNTVGKNIAIALLAAFNIAGGLLFATQFDGGVSIVLGAIPLTIFSTFVALPILRAPIVWWQNRKQHAHNIRKRLFKAIFASSEEKLAFDEVVARANREGTTEEKLDADTLRELLEATLREVGGSLDTDTRDKLVMDLERLRNEGAARAEHAVTVEESAVVHTTR